MTLIAIVCSALVALGAAIGIHEGQPIAGLVVGILAACGLVEFLHRANK
jgi:hypothetical protein